MTILNQSGAATLAMLPEVMPSETRVPEKWGAMDSMDVKKPQIPAEKKKPST